jgi:hypothetical protein
MPAVRTSRGTDRQETASKNGIAFIYQNAMLFFGFNSSVSGKFLGGWRPE